MRTAVTMIATLFLVGSTVVHAWADFDWGNGVIPTLNEIRFRKWMQEYNKQYGSKEEYRFRFAQFTRSVFKIESHNAKHESTKMGLNEWSDMTREEFQKELPKLPFKNVTEPFRHFDSTPELGGNDSINWTDRGFITEVKNTPKNCKGASYAFVAADALEATYKNQTGNLLNLSPKQIMDCATDYSISECDYGDTHDAFRYIKDGRKLQELSTYPVNMNNRNCKYNANKGIAGLNSIYAVPVNPTQIKQALQYGPVTSVINSSPDLFRDYQSGIIDFSADECNPKEFNLYVLIVGYGKGFFIVKNNWGSSWGENGYFRISDSNDNVCGILSTGYLYQISNTG